MPAGLKIARLFLLAGAVLLLAGLLFSALLPFRTTLPPYFLTPLLALGYGAWSWRRYRARGDR